MRTRVLDTIRQQPDRQIITLVAPAGYGKTSVLAQLAGTGPVAWLTVDESSNDPSQLLAHLAAALARVARIDPDVPAAIESGSTSTRASVGRLLASLGERGSSALVVIDDAHRITNHASRDLLAEFVGHLPALARAAIAGRQAIELPVAAWRARGEMLEFGPTELAFDEREAAELVRGHGLRLTDDAIRRITAQTEGWPALTMLAAITVARRHDGAGVHVSGADLPIGDYLRLEVLERQTPERARFLKETSILEHLSGPLCDAVTGGPDSATTLRHLAHSTVLIDAYGGRYRYHPLLREFLLEELQAQDPQLVIGLHQRASVWYESAGDLDTAIRHAFAAGDLDRAATLLSVSFLQQFWTARHAALMAWLGQFGDEEIRRRPWLAVLAAFKELEVGNTAAAGHYAELAERGSFHGPPPDGSVSFESERAMLRVLMARGGAKQMLVSASFAAEQEGDGPWGPLALWFLATARQVNGDLEVVDGILEKAVASARAYANSGLAYSVAGHRAAVAADLGDWAKAAAIMDDASALVGEEVKRFASAATACSMLVRLAMRGGDVALARRELESMVALRPKLAGQGALAVMSLIGFARAYLACGDPAGARAVLAQASDILRRHPDLGVLPTQVAELRRQIAALPIGPGGASTLTAAELRVLALLPYYLSFADIGARLGVRATTIKSHALSIYGKLGASSRPEAVELAIEAGLLEPFLP